MVILETKIGDLRLRSPTMAVSGIFGMGYHNLSPKQSGVGAVVTKSVTFKSRPGNLEPRIIETPAGLLNSIGLQNPGIKKFISEEIPKLRILEVPKIGSVAGSNISEYVKCSSLLASCDDIDAIELNVSCPNVERGGIEFGCDPSYLGQLVRKTRKAIGNKTMIVKLTPNVTDIAVPAQAAIDNGADAISLINTLRGMAIDLNTQQPKLGNKVGGLSGKAIHPVAVYMVYRCYVSCCRRNRIPIIGMGGVYNGEDALELMLAGASCVGIGTAMFRDELRSKSVFERVQDYLIEYMNKNGIEHIHKLVGQAAKKRK